MVKKGKNFSGNVTPLFNSILVQPTEDEGDVSERPSESQPIPSLTHPSEDQHESYPDPSPKPSSSIPIPNSNPEGSGGNQGAQAVEIKDLKAQIKQLKKKTRPIINHHKAWFRAARLKKQQKKKDMEKSKKRMSVSKQGRKVVKSSKAMDHTLAQDEGKTYSKVKEPKTSSKTKELHLSGDTLVVEDKGSAEMGGSTKVTDLQQSAAKIKDQVLRESDTPTVPTMTSTPTLTVFGDDETIAQVLTKAYSKVLTLKPLPKIDPKAKGKGMIEEEDESDTESEYITEAEKKFKMLANDEEMAIKVQEEWEAEEEKERLNADKILAEKLQEEEREKFTIEERAKLLHDTIAAQSRFLAQQRYEVKRSDENFIVIVSIEDERLIKHLNKKAAGIKNADSIKEGNKEEEESTKKRKLSTRKKIKLRKRRFRQDTSEDDETNSEKENDELRLNKPQYDETKDLEKINLNVVIRSNGQRRYFSTLMRVLSIFDSEDLSAVYQLVMDRYQDEIPEGFNRVLWGDLMIMFNPRLVIHMLVEKKYPLRKKVLLQMLKLKLEFEEDSTMALELIRFVKKLIAELKPENSDGDEEDL
ncbi:hypothetical protein Tco_0146545 [Tanacetum coccineum]